VVKTTSLKEECKKKEEKGNRKKKKENHAIVFYILATLGCVYLFGFAESLLLATVTS
jgi:hypothetical protein